jgi:hypothetical protein
MQQELELQQQPLALESQLLERLEQVGELEQQVLQLPVLQRPELFQMQSRQ